MSALAPVMQGLFTEYLAQRRASPHTVANYRDTFRQLLALRGGKDRESTARPSTWRTSTRSSSARSSTTWRASERSASQRGTCASASSTRCSPTRSFRCPENAETIRRALAIPAKRRERTVVSYLTPEEASALLATPDRSTALGWRDYLLLLVGIQSGLRVSELTGLRWADVTFGAGACLHTRGKGRRERATPLLAETARALETWRNERHAVAEEPMF